MKSSPGMGFQRDFWSNQKSLRVRWAGDDIVVANGAWKKQITKRVFVLVRAVLVSVAASLFFG